MLSNHSSHDLKYNKSFFNDTLGVDKSFLKNHSYHDFTTPEPVEYIYYLNFKESNEMEVLLKNLNFWVQALLVKLIPCAWMVILSAILTHKMTSVQHKRRHLQRMQSSIQRTNNLDARERRTYRTTRMLIIIVFLFALIEFPNGIINLLSGILDQQFVLQIYDKLGDLLDFFTIVNSSINFVLYCAMSHQFRKTFSSIFLKFFL